MNFLKKIKKLKYPYIIAEIGANHNGDMELAKKMILSAKKCGANAVKFQSWTDKSVFSKIKYEENFFLGDDYRNRSDFTLEEMVKKFSISKNQLIEMAIFCKKIGIDFSSTPFSKEEVDDLVDLNVSFIKIASMDLNNYPFLEYIAKKNIPIILSTGFSNLEEISKSIDTITRKGNENIALLHCVSTYPTPPKELNLNNIKSFSTIFPYTIGLSDHSIGSTAAIIASSIGAKIIEKHFTLDKSLPGWDHKISADPEELRRICEETKNAIDMLGSFQILTTEKEENKLEFRRSAVTKIALKKGTVIK